MKAEISEIFESIQGEGILAGVRQLFIRFAKCNLRCTYCDTKLNPKVCRNLVEGEVVVNPVGCEYVQRLIDRSRVHSISFTGGEPLLYADFIASLKKTKPFYLETNMSLPEAAKKLRFVDYVAGDLKVKESGNEWEDLFENTVRCFKILRNTRKRLTFCKVVLPSEFDIEETVWAVEQVTAYVRCVVLQPVFGSRLEKILKLQDLLLDKCDVRVIPQIHKYLGLK